MGQVGFGFKFCLGWKEVRQVSPFHLEIIFQRVKTNVSNIRHDEIGTPICAVVDDQVDTVTLRGRDSKNQVRVPQHVLLDKREFAKVVEAL